MVTSEYPGQMTITGMTYIITLTLWLNPFNVTFLYSDIQLIWSESEEANA